MDAAQDSVSGLLAQWSRERPDTDTSALGIVVRIDRLAKLLDAATGRALSAIGLKHWEYDVLSALRRQGSPYQLPATELARATLLTSGGMTARIDGLVRRGYVERRSDPADGRSHLVTLTREGLEIVERALTARLDGVAGPLSSLSRTQIRELSGSLESLLSRLEFGSTT